MPNLNDWMEPIRRLVHRVDRLESGAFLEHSSISSGRMRFIGGLLRVDEGGRVEIVGTLQVDGETTVTGHFTVEGPWSLTGAGEITGDVRVTGRFIVDGPWELNGDGKIAGDVDLTGTMYVTGEIVVGGAGLVKIGGMVLDPSARGGSIKFPGGPEVYADGDELSLYGDASFVTLDGSSAKINGPGLRWIEITSTNVRVAGLPTISGVEPNLYADTSGNLHRIV